LGLLLGSTPKWDFVNLAAEFAFYATDVLKEYNKK